ncbi:hypothetical protein EVAR_48352_1 [Eumeta japonica]|uniref:Uncharacterized protein n=1 Tax=Eumeta variegata TaxID=151549 RepID=A0A4C1WLS8_EUMVA|nr:hypothetical protein EVAR_48352_1 [Eumeta japonica]
MFTLCGMFMLRQVSIVPQLRRVLRQLLSQIERFAFYDTTQTQCKLKAADYRVLINGAPSTVSIQTDFLQKVTFKIHFAFHVCLLMDFQTE